MCENEIASRTLLGGVNVSRAHMVANALNAEPPEDGVRGDGDGMDGELFSLKHTRTRLVRKTGAKRGKKMRLAPVTRVKSRGEFIRRK